MSPKAQTEIVLQAGNELKIVFPQEGINPIHFEHYNFNHFYLQPMFGPLTDKNTEACKSFIKDHPKWKLSIQTHKVLGIP